MERHRSRKEKRRCTPMEATETAVQPLRFTTPPLGPGDYHEALQLQAASNLAGVVKSFAALMPKILEATRSTGDANTHPIAVLFAYKIAALAGMEPLDHGYVRQVDGSWFEGTYVTAYTVASAEAHKTLDD